MAEAPQKTLDAPLIQGMATETDADLLAYMAMANEAVEEAQAAFVEFHRRHAGFLYAGCKREFGRALPIHYAIEDLVGDTLTRTFERAGTFDAKVERDPVRLRRLTRAWLFAIARNILQDVYRGRPTLEQTVAPDALDELAANSPPEDSESVRLVQRAIETVLDDRERDVLRETFLWHKPGCAYQRLPNDVASDLARTWETSTENLRKIRAAAMRKVKSFLLDAGIETLIAGRTL